MEEFISVDEALEVLFDKSDMDENQKLKRLFNYYQRGKVDFYVELFGRHSRYGVPHEQQESLLQPEKLEGCFKLNREYWDEYFHSFLLVKSGVVFKDSDDVASECVIDPYDFHIFYESYDINVVEGAFGEVWCLRRPELNENNIYYTHPIYPTDDDILIERDQILNLKEAINPHRKPHKRPDITEKSNKDNMEVLGAALSVLAQFREQCESKGGVIQGAKIAKVIEEKAGLFWPETYQPPQEPEVLRKTINNWLKKTK